MASTTETTHHQAPGLYLLSGSESSFEHDALMLCLEICKQCSRINYPVNYVKSDDHSAFLDCGLPCVVSKSGCYHCGLTACIRQLVMLHAEDSTDFTTSLLGYHNNCLRSCAEVSPWTRLCEHRLPTIASDPKQYGAPFAASLELHLRTLMRIPSTSNDLGSSQVHPSLKPTITMEELVGDMENLMSKNTVRRTFVDHTSVTILDLIIFAFILRLPKEMYESLREVQRWYSRMWSIPAVQTAANKRGFQENLLKGTVDDGLLIGANSLIEPRKKAGTRNRKIHYDPTNVIAQLSDSGIQPTVIDASRFYKLGRIDWDSLPASIHPWGGNLPKKRLQRKQEQLDNLVQGVMALAKDGDTVVDFCSGGGHLGLVLAYLLPSCRIIMIENKEESLRCAVTRANAQNLTNARFYQCNLTKFTGRFQIGVSLHACGSATDLVLDQCLAVGAAFVLCPCCYGSIKGDAKLTYPRSAIFGQKLSGADYKVLAHSADQTEFSIEMADRGKQAMQYVDWDRGLLAGEMGYSTALTTMVPAECTPKNNVLIGVKGLAIPF